MRTAMLRLLAASSLFVLIGGCSAGNEEPLAARDSELIGPLRLCGGRYSADCGDASYCRTAAGTCPGPAQAGICSARPQLCTDIYAPVCGCDGVTYANSCYANRAGATVASSGACAVTACKSNKDCAATDYCEKKVGNCAGVGECSARSRICPKIYKPVCGCNGVTYGNSCEAAGAGASVASEGACPSVFCGGIANFPCPGLGKCVDDPSDDCDPTSGGADCSGLCQCVQNVLCIRGTHFDNNPKVCACVPDAGVTTCGSTTCAAGTVCCNASCGICTPPGGACIQVICDPTM